MRKQKEKKMCDWSRDFYSIAGNCHLWTFVLILNLGTLQKLRHIRWENFYENKFLKFFTPWEKNLLNFVILKLIPLQNLAYSSHFFRIKKSNNELNKINYGINEKYWHWICFYLFHMMPTQILKKRPWEMLLF